MEGGVNAVARGWLAPPAWLTIVPSSRGKWAEKSALPGFTFTSGQQTFITWGTLSLKRKNESMTRLGWVLLIMTMGAVACDNSSTENETTSNKQRAAKKAKKAKKKGATDTPTAVATETASAPAPTATAQTQQCGSSKTIPEIPPGRSDPPTVEEWKTACEVNTQGVNSEAQDCTSFIKREWLKVTCRNNITGVENFEGFGSEGLNYFKVVRPPEIVSYVVRLRKGHSQKVRICRTDQRASLFVSWPSSKEQPTIVAVGRGPKCERH